MTSHLLPWIAAAAMAGTADPQDAVRSGQMALDHWRRYPWYDATTDGLRPLDLSPPWWEAWLPNYQVPSGGWRPSLPNMLLQWVAWILIALTLGTMIYLLVRTFLARRKAHADGCPGKMASDAAEDRRRVEALPLPAVRRQFDLLDEAEQQYRQGHYAQAIIYLFSYQLVQLDKQHLIHLSQGKTNRQYLRELGSRKSLRELLGQTMVVFEDSFFGQRGIEQSRFESCWNRLHEFQTLVAEALA